MPGSKKGSPPKARSPTDFDVRILYEKIFALESKLDMFQQEHATMTKRLDDIDFLLKNQIKDELDSQLLRVEQLESAAQSKSTVASAATSASASPRQRKARRSFPDPVVNPVTTQSAGRRRRKL